MIIHRLRVEGLRTFRNPLVLDNLDPGLNLIHAPNESGKSTLILALARALFDRYNTGGEEIESLRPWGTDLAPSIELEFTHAGTRYSLRKRFLIEPESVLKEWTGARFEALANATSADERARAMLQGAPTGRGASKLSHWGLAQLLWLPQSREGLELPTPDDSLVNVLLEYLGGAALSPTEEKLIAAMDDLYEEQFTKGRGQVKKGSPLQQAETTLESAAEQVAELRRRHTAASGFAESLAESERKLTDTETALADTVEQIAALQAAADAETALEKQIAEREALCNQQRAEYERSRERFSELQRLTAQLTEADTACTTLTPELAAAESAATVARETQLAADTAATRAKDQVRLLSQQQQRGRKLAKLHDQLQQRDTLTTARGAVEALETELAQAQQQRKTLAVPTSRELKDARADTDTLIELRGKLAALSLRVSVTLESPRDLTWTPSALSEPSHQPQTSSATFTAPQAGTLAIDGVGTLAIHAGLDATTDLRADLTQRETRLAQLFSRYQCADFAGLEACQRAGDILDAAIERLVADLAKSLPAKCSSIEDLTNSLSKLEGEIATARAELDLAPEAPLPDLPDMEQLESASRAADTVLDEAERQAKLAATALRTHEETLNRLRLQQKEAATRQAQLQEEVTRRLTVDGPLATQEQAIQTLAAELQKQTDTLKGLQQQLPPADERARPQLERYERIRHTLNTERDTYRDDVSRYDVQLTALAAEGLHSRLAEAEEACALAQSAYDRAFAEAEAIRRLAAAAHAWREAATQGVVTPIADTVNRYVQHIRGTVGARQRLQVAENFRDLALELPDGSTGRLTDLSWGTWEQILLALRLAYGGLLARHPDSDTIERQLVVLDDPLVNTDPARHDRALDLIQRAATEELQILVLTAFPERYRALSGPRYDLRALAELSVE